MRKFQLRSLCVVIAAALISNTALGQSYGNKKIAHFHLSGALTETPQEDPFGFTAGKITSLKGLLHKLSKARKDPAVSGVVLTFSGMGMGIGQIEEIRDEITRFKAVDKRVFVHVEEMSTGSYALLSAASDLCVVPTADIWLTGFYGEQLYLKNMLHKIGCEADILQMGDFKSAGEMFMREGPSEAARENIDWLLDGMYDSLVNMIAESRDMTPEKVKQLIDDGPYSAERAKEAGLVDHVMYRDEFIEEIKDIYGRTVNVDNRYGAKEGVDLDFSNPFALFSMFGELLGSGKQKTRPDSIGIVYVEGAIQSGYQQPSPFGGSSGAFSGDIRSALQEAAEDDSIKAVVLRVDSPGGSALASEIILRATQEVRSKKPLIVSMGNVAGSGGYYVACGSDAIFADATTITGSIGVVGGKIVTAGLWDKLGVNWVPVQRGENADLLNTLEPFDQSERKRMYTWMEEIYGTFKTHVTNARGDKLAKPIDELAGGRVYTGAQALELGLIDKIGGLHEAVAYAARKASISDFDVRVVPEPKDFFQMMFGEMTGTGKRPSDISVKAPVNWFGTRSSMFEALLPLLEKLEPMKAKALMNALQKVELMHQESVLTVMPMELVIR